jgi:hypothetical protein
LSPAAYASNTVVICGETTNADEFTVTGFELMVSSESSDGYNGQVGKSWQMKIGSAESPWISSPKGITAKTIRAGGKTRIEITMVQGRGPSGPVGTRYILDDLYAEETTLEKWNFGGFTGKLRVGSFLCLTAAD